jgi:hypothetical protein
MVHSVGSWIHARSCPLWTNTEGEETNLLSIKSQLCFGMINVVSKAILTWLLGLGTNLETTLARPGTFPMTSSSKYSQRRRQFSFMAAIDGTYHKLQHSRCTTTPHSTTYLSWMFSVHTYTPTSHGLSSRYPSRSHVGIRADSCIGHHLSWFRFGTLNIGFLSPLSPLGPRIWAQYPWARRSVTSEWD